jgi:hypothetical protein
MSYETYDSNGNSIPDAIQSFSDMYAEVMSD